MRLSLKLGLEAGWTPPMLLKNLWSAAYLCLTLTMFKSWAARSQRSPPKSGHHESRGAASRYRSANLPWKHSSRKLQPWKAALWNWWCLWNPHQNWVWRKASAGKQLLQWHFRVAFCRTKLATGPDSDSATVPRATRQRRRDAPTVVEGVSNGAF